MKPPFPGTGGRIGPEEFALMGAVLASYLKKFFPCERVEFFPLPAGGDPAGAGEDAAWIGRVARRRSMAFDKVSGRLFLPLWHGEEVIAVAALSGGDSYLISRMDELRVMEKTRQVSGLLHDLRDDLRDNQTGLFNASFFARHLEAMTRAGGFTLGLMELAAGTHRDLLQVLAQLKRCAAVLVNYFSVRTPLCHLGSGIFAVFLPSMDDTRCQESARFLVSWLRREGLSRVKLAMVAVGAGESRREVERRAWDTLKKARVRGGFAWAVSGLERASAMFAPPPPAVLNRLRNGWKDRIEFSLILFKADSPGSGGPELVSMLRGKLPEDVLLAGNGADEAFALIGSGPDAARDAAEKVRDALAGNEGVSCSAGIAWYPCLDYSRGALPANCRKALLHASFYGPGSVVVFDGVSLNVSGDRYYMEGDLGGAVREYRQGLRLDPEGVTLMNSLGVALVEGGRRAEAREMFVRAAELAPDDFMARYNLALIDLSAGDRAAAVDGLRRCLSIEPENSEAMLQLAAILVSESRFAEVVELLDEGRHPLLARTDGGSASVRGNLVRGMLYRYLGQALQRLGRLREAVAAVETAAGCNPRSSKSAALLGELYLETGEDTGLALTLCAKAVKLDAASVPAWTALGRVQLARGDFHAAEESLRQARSLAPRDRRVLELLAEAFDGQGKRRDAAAVRARAVRLNP